MRRNEFWYIWDDVWCEMHPEREPLCAVDSDEYYRFLLSMRPADSVLDALDELDAKLDMWDD